MLGHDLYTWVAHREWINADCNFDTLGNSALLLFRCLTADGWSGLMGDAMAEQSRGGCSEEEGNCGHVSAIPFFVSFQARAHDVLTWYGPAAALPPLPSLPPPPPLPPSGSFIRLKSLHLRHLPLR